MINVYEIFIRENLHNFLLGIPNRYFDCFQIEFLIIFMKNEILHYTSNFIILILYIFIRILSTRFNLN